MSPPRLSSSVVLLRRASDARSSFEVLMAKRSSKMKSFPSMYVFPGGIQEPEDRRLGVEFGKGTPECASKICAVRELFEEAGVLLRPSVHDINHVEAVHMSREDRVDAQKRVHADATQFAEILESVSCDLPIAQMQHWVTFVTPEMEKRRFNTDFYICVVDDAEIELEQKESTHYEWLVPQRAMELNASGNLTFLPPQYFVLSTIAKCETANEVVAQARARLSPPLAILPVPVAASKEAMVLAYPGDEEHTFHPGREGARCRVICSAPVGRGGYDYELNGVREGPFCFPDDLVSAVAKL